MNFSLKLLGDETHAVDGDNEVITQPAALVGGYEFHEALTAGTVQFQGDALTFNDVAVDSDGTHIVGHLLLAFGIGRRVEARDAHIGLRVFPREALGIDADVFP